jgi:hypothetical protein
LTDDMQAAATVSRLERLVLAKVITADEQAREKDEVFRQVQVAMANADANARLAAGMAPPPAPALPLRGAGVWLGSFQSENQAQLAWASLQLTHASELSALQMEVKQVRLRRRGVTYHLNAGPLSDRKAAQALCKALKQRRQFCQATTLGR